MNNQPAYFITVLETCEADDKWCCKTGDTRCWGFYYSLEEAIAACNGNYTDMRETIYDYAIIEKFYPGICNPDWGQRWFFKWDDEKCGFYEMEEPECLKHLCCFAIG